MTEPAILKNTTYFSSLTKTDNNYWSYENILPVNVISVVGLNDENTFLAGDAYPNPANTSITIPLVEGDNILLNIALYDVTGKNRGSIYAGNTSGKEKIIISTESLPEGLYFYRISTQDGRQIVKKFTVKH